MNTNIRHETPRATQVFRVQFQKVGRSLRPELIGLALILSPLVIMGMALLMSRDAALDYPSELNLLLPAAAFVLPFRIWIGQRLFRHGDFQSMPVERQKHVLIRVGAGAAWALGLAAVVVLLFNALAWAAGSPTIGTAPWQWLVPLGSVATAYLFGSGVMLALRHPVRWGAAVVLAFVVSGVFGLGTVLRPITRVLVHGDLGLHSVVTGGASGMTWAVALLFWLGLGLIAVALASLRHREV
jgi:hypothetical protein